MIGIYYGGGTVAALALSVMSIISVIVSHILLAIQLVGCWFSFKKMDLPGWKGIIPIYNTYVLFSELWETGKFWRMIIFSCISAVSFIIGEILFAVAGIFSVHSYPEVTMGTAGLAMVIAGSVFLIAGIVMLVLAFILCLKIYKMTAKAFGLKTAWAWGMIFVPYIMFPIIGFNRNIVYYGKVEHLEPVDAENT